MSNNNAGEIARLVKEKRVLKNYTQQELADATGISLRSIQRIENAEVMPRVYTLKVLTEHLEFTMEPDAQLTITAKAPLNLQQKKILSFGTAALMFLLGGAYIFQSPTFPEGAFELFLYIAAFVSVYTIFMFRLWR